MTHGAWRAQGAHTATAATTTPGTSNMKAMAWKRIISKNAVAIVAAVAKRVSCGAFRGRIGSQVLPGQQMRETGTVRSLR